MSAETRSSPSSMSSSSDSFVDVVPLLFSGADDRHEDRGGDSDRDLFGERERDGDGDGERKTKGRRVVPCEFSLFTNMLFGGCGRFRELVHALGGTWDGGSRELLSDPSSVGVSLKEPRSCE